MLRPPTLSYEIKTVKGAGMTGGGLFNSVFTGHGKLGLMCDGYPIVIPPVSPPQQPVFVDTDAVVGWSAQLNTSLHRSQSVGSMIRGGSGGGRPTAPGRTGVRDRTAQ